MYSMLPIVLIKKRREWGLERNELPESKQVDHAYSDDICLSEWLEQCLSHLVEQYNCSTFLNLGNKHSLR